MKISGSIADRIESANLKIMSLLIKYSLLAAVQRDISRGAARSLQPEALPLRHAKGRSFAPG